MTKPASLEDSHALAARTLSACAGLVSIVPSEAASRHQQLHNGMPLGSSIPRHIASVQLSVIGPRVMSEARKCTA